MSVRAITAVVEIHENRIGGDESEAVRIAHQQLMYYAADT
jgi:hypothetical protein